MALNWKALKDGMCPKCHDPLRDLRDQSVAECSRATCDFSIGHAKLQEIITRPARARQPQGEGWERFNDNETSREHEE